MSEFLVPSCGQYWEPHEYQKKAIALGVEQGAVGLFLDPGLGKTSIMLAIFKILRDQGFVKRMLVIAPLRVCYMTWPEEVAKWEQFNNLRVSILHGRKKQDRLSDNAEVFLINPEGIDWLSTGKKIEILGADMLVVDESTKFKKPGTKRFKALKKILPHFSRRYILTGTPAPNGAMDLFGQLYILDGGNALGKFITHFRNKYFYQSGYGGYTWNIRDGAYEDILGRISGFTLRMEATDYLELPRLVFNDIVIPMPEETRAAYEELEREFIIEIQGEEIAALSQAALSTKLRQICNGGAYTESGEVVEASTAKAEALRDLIEQVNSPVLVMYNFRHDIKRICKALNSNVPYIGGGVGGNEAIALAKRFNAGDLPVLLAHPQSAGHGLNLQRHANHVALFGMPWDLELYDQFIRRVWRQGNPNTHVFVHRLVMERSIEQAVSRALEGKDRTQRFLLDSLKSYYAYQEIDNG